MTNCKTFMLKNLLVALIIVSLTACSTMGKQQYDVTTMQSVGNALLGLADEKRQLGQYQEAFVYYKESEKYALKRNDKYSFGLSQLKRASLHIKLGELAQAEPLIVAIKELQSYESVGLENEILFVEAQYAHFSGQTEQAILALKTLQKNYAKNEEKRLYYQFVSWVYAPDSVALTTIEQAYQTLLALKQQRELYNIEIFSYAVSHYGQYLASQQMSRAESVLTEAVAHFSMLEQSNNIARMYDLLADYFDAIEVPKKAQYYRKQATRIRTLKII